MQPSLAMRLSKGDSGIRETLEAMAAAVVDELQNGTAARRVTRAVVGEETSDLGKMQRIWRFARDRVRFKPDPRRIELVRTPDRMFQIIDQAGRFDGDCDDRAVLIASMLGAAGIRPGFFVIGPDPSGPFGHVFAGGVVRGKLIPMDPQEGFPVGSMAPAGRVAAFMV